MTTRDLLLELGTEELPPKSLKRLMKSLAASFENELQTLQFEFEKIDSFATPRRLALKVTALAERQPEQKIEKRGPSVKAAFDADGNATRAATGFAHSCGIEDVKSLPTIKNDKGEWLVYKDVRQGKTIGELIESICITAIADLPIERGMHWGAGRVTFVRPVHWVVLLYGDEVLPATLFGIESSRTTRGHRFMSNGQLELASAGDYADRLRAAFVIPEFEARQTTIREQIEHIAKREVAEVVIDVALLDEVTALVEWPVALMGTFDPEFLKVPEEAIISAMKSHQRYFHLVDSKNHLLPRFITVANIESTDPEMVIKGNERVIAPRLSDAAFFYEQDARVRLIDKLDRLKRVVFQAKLGTYHDKTERISKLAGALAARIGESAAQAERAGLLCKVDLITDMVIEFPELQGLMGSYYASRDGEEAEVASAIAEHYLPVQSGGPLPSTRIGQCVAISDKLDTLTGLFGIGQPPTGSRDPFALRRQTLGVIRICIECDLPLDIEKAISHAAELHSASFETHTLVGYFYERLTGWYLDQGIPADTVNAARLANHPAGTLGEFDRLVRAIQAFRSNKQASGLVATNKRVANILKQTDASSSGVSTDLFTVKAEHTLFDAVARLKQTMPKLADYDARLLALANLQPEIDKYFDEVLVMDEDLATRNNRIATLASMRELFLDVADVSVLQM